MRTATSAFLLVLSFAVAPDPVAAEDNFVLRVRPTGLSALGHAAPSQVPRSIELPELDKELHECSDSAEPIVAHLTDGELEVSLGSVYFGIRDGRLVMDAEANVDASVQLDVDNGDLCEGDLACEVTGSIAPFRAGLRFAPATTAEGGIELREVDADLGITGDAVELDVQGCALGEKVEGAVEAVKDWLLQRFTPRLEQVAAEMITERAQGLLADSIPLRVSYEEVELQTWFHHVQTDASTGVTMSGQALAAAGSHGPAERQPSEQPPTDAALGGEDLSGDLLFAVSDRLINDVLEKSWRAGVLQSSLSELTSQIDLSESGIARKLGFPAESEIGLSLELGQAPNMTFGSGGQGLHLELAGLEATLTTEVPGESTSTVRIATEAMAQVEPSIHRDTGALILEPRALRLGDVHVEAGESTLDVGPERLNEFLRKAGLALLSNQLRSVPIAPAYGPTRGVYVRIRSVQASGGWLRAGAELGVADPNDDTPPETDLDATPRFVAPGFASVPVSGSDDRTPARMLRFTAALDGEPLVEEPSMAHEIAISVGGGRHTLEVAAVDLAGNVDPTPEERELVVDDVPPTLDVTRTPSTVVHGNLVAKWRAQDDRTEVTTHWQLRRFEQGSELGPLVRQGEAGARGRVNLQGLDSGTHYVLRIAAEDEAGNVTAEKHGATTQPGGGACSTAGARGSSSPWAWLALVFLALRPLRRSRRDRALRRWAGWRGPGAIAVFAGLWLALPSSAAAQAIGTMLSGPTDADGTSSYWNPAAMVRGEGTRLDLGSGINFIRVSYETPDGGQSHTMMPKPEPTIGGYTDALGEDWRLGVTMGVPGAAGARWSRDGGAADITRYYATEARTFHLGLMPTVAYRVNPWLAVGGGLRIVYSSLQAKLDKDMGSRLNQEVGSSEPDAPFAYAHPQLAAPVDMGVSGWGVGAIAGVLLTPHEQLKMGVGLHTPSNSRADGKLDVRYPERMREFVADAAPSADLPELQGSLNATLRMPLSVFTAIAVEPTDRLELRVDYRFANKSSITATRLNVTQNEGSANIDDITIVRGYRDRHSIGLRLTRTWLDDRLVTGLRLRWQNNTVPEETVAPNVIDFSRTVIGLTGSYAVSDTVTLTLEYSKYFLPDRNVDESLRQPIGEGSLSSWNRPSPYGTYRGAADRVGLVLSVFL